MAEGRLAKAGKELIRGNFGNAVKALAAPTPIAVPINSASYRRGNGQWLFGGEVDIYFEFSGHASCVKAYEHCAPLASIINMKAQAHINGKPWILNSDGKVSQTPQAKRIRERMKRPNPLQTWSMFDAQGKIYEQLFGYNVVLPIMPVGFEKEQDRSFVASMWNIPPSMLTIEEYSVFNFSGNVNANIKSVHFNYAGSYIPLDKEKLFFFRDFVPSFTSLVLPESRLKACEMEVNNIIGVYESRNVLINRRGALGILSQEKGDNMGALPLPKGEKEQIQSDFQRYGLLNNQYTLIITEAAMKWQPMGYPTKDLMLFEEVQDDIMRLCDQFGVPYRLLSSEKAASYNDVKEFETKLYQDIIIPESKHRDEQWDIFWGFEKTDMRNDRDFSHVSALQKDRLQEANARKAIDEACKLEWEAGLITKDQWLEKLGEDPLPNGAGAVTISEATDSNTPLAVTIGVGGVQSLISVLTTPGLSAEARSNTLQIIFGIAPEDANRMVTENNNNGNQQAQSGQSGAPGQQGDQEQSPQ